MNRKYVLAALVLLAVAGVIAFELTRGGEDGSSTQFNAYASGETTQAPAKAGGHGSEPGEQTGQEKPARRAVKPVEDTLNRPGPEPDPAIKERYIKNRRPRDQAPPAPNTGSLSKQDIRKGLDAATPLVKECYDKTLVEFPDAAGKVTVGFRIIGEGGQGHVEMTEMDEENTTLFDQKLHDCMQERIAEAAFPAPADGAVNVRFPFVFSTDKKE